MFWDHWAGGQLFIVWIFSFLFFFNIEKNKSVEPVDELCWTNSMLWCLPGGTRVKNPPDNAGDESDTGSLPGSGRSPGVGNGNPLQYSCLENLMDRGAWWAAVHRVAKSWTQPKQLSTIVCWIIFLFLRIVERNCCGYCVNIDEKQTDVA